LRDELGWTTHTTVLAIEDVHWADEATFDVLRYLVRRVSELPVVLVLTYRDDELATDHPLRQLLGLASPARRGRPSRAAERATAPPLRQLLGLASRAGRVRRLPLARLSVAAVRRLSATT